MSSVEYSLVAYLGGNSSKVTVSAASAQSAAFKEGERHAVITPTVDVWFRRGTNPTALADGTDQFLLANQAYRIHGIKEGEKLAFIAGAAGSVYITPNA